MSKLLLFRSHTCPLHGGFLPLISLEVNLSWRRPVRSLLCLSLAFAKATLVECPTDPGAGGAEGAIVPPDSALPLHMGTRNSCSSAGMNGFSYLLSHIQIPFLMICPFPSAQPMPPLCSAPIAPLGSCTLQHLPEISFLWPWLPLLGRQIEGRISADPLGSLEASFLSGWLGCWFFPHNHMQNHDSLQLLLLNPLHHQ